MGEFRPLSPSVLERGLFTSLAFIVTAFIQLAVFALILPTDRLSPEWKWKLIFSNRRKERKGDHKLSPIPLRFRRGPGPRRSSQTNKQTIHPSGSLLLKFRMLNIFFVYLLNAHVHFYSRILTFSFVFLLSQSLSRAKFVPDFQPTEEVAQPALSTHPDVPPDEKFSPPTPEEAERIISHLLPRWVVRQRIRIQNARLGWV